MLVQKTLRHKNNATKHLSDEFFCPAGKAYRSCLCLSESCSWQEPNFDQCAEDMLWFLDKDVNDFVHFEGILPQFKESNKKQKFYWLKKLE